MIRIIFLILTGVFLVAGSAQNTAQAQNIFLTPNKSQKADTDESSSNKLPFFVVPQNRDVKSKAAKVARAPREKIQLRPLETNIRTKDFEIFNQLGSLDLNLLQAGARPPQTQQELMQVAAALNMPLVSDVLAMKKMLEQGALTEVARVLNSR
ncbi:MAG: hypothetical protein KDJ35_08725 [Alphaproteobacteria bacterium]|nr:hypothetical protein [Alphaproteobacteria bacterium]